MGNITEKDGSLSADIEDGEAIYDTIARDIAYKRCSVSQEPMPTRSAVARSSRRVRTARSISRTKKSIKRSLSRRRTSREKKANMFRLSDMEVQVDGKIAK